jgi:hypothetical protein
VIAGYGKGRVMDVVVSVEDIVFIKTKEHGCHGFDGYARIWVSDSNLYLSDPFNPCS